jgi:holo-[acyl-carrier protein] synthase
MEEALVRWGARLLRKVLHPAEVDVFHLRSRAGRPALGYLASRWAVKEATFKAFGQSRGEVLFTDMKVTNDGQTGKPVLQLEGKTKQLALRLGVNQIHLSISHERDYALAQVILE